MEARQSVKLLPGRRVTTLTQPCLEGEPRPRQGSGSGRSREKQHFPASSTTTEMMVLTRIQTSQISKLLKKII